MSWLHSLWLKSLILIALLPTRVGVIWLWGAVGLLLSLAGILSKMTITTTANMVGILFQTPRPTQTFAT